MKYATFSKYLARLEETPKRLEITDILTDLIKELPKDEVGTALYLASGYLNAPFESKKFCIAEKMMAKIISQAYGTHQKPDINSNVDRMYKEKGDLGNVAFELSKNSRGNDLNIKEVYEKLTEIAQIEGGGSQEAKISQTAELLNKLDSVSAKYTVRIILGTTRLGFTELTIIAALASYLGDKSLADRIEKTYNVHPDIGYIAKLLKQEGLDGLAKVKIEAGVPVLAQKAQRVKDVEEAKEKMGRIWAEYKFDGTRVQLHIDKGRSLVKTFTRKLEETSHMYPDILSDVAKYLKADSAILDGEAIGYNRATGEFLPFQETIQRKRKHDVPETVKDIPLKYYVFDILFLNGEDQTHKPLKERHAALEKVLSKGAVAEIAEHIETDNLAEVKDMFESAKRRHLEGLILKKPDDPYQAGARSYSWIKLKKADEKLLADSVDLVVLGYYAGRGARSKFGIGGFLAGVYDETIDTFKTVSKIGTGLSDEDWKELKQMCDKVKIEKAPANVEMNKISYPHIYVSPKIVVEVGADEITVSPTHTSGYALRFPRLIRFRDDKNARDATTVKEIEKMYKNQKRGSLKG